MMVPLTHLIYLGLIAFGLLFLGVAQSFPGGLSPRDIGPAALPQALAILMIALILVDLVISRRRARYVPVAEVLLAFTVALALGVVLWLAVRVGFFVVLPFALFIGLWLSGSRRLLANTLYSILFPAALWLVFDRLLHIPLASF